MKFSTINKYKLLAWALLCKQNRENSIIYSDESVAKFIRRNHLTISERTFRKYLNMALDLGLVKDYGKHRQLIDWEMYVKVLDLKVNSKYLNQILNNRPEKGPIKSFSKMVQWVEETLIIDSLLPQEAKINQRNKQRLLAEDIIKASNNKTFLQKGQKKGTKKFMKEAASLNITVEKFAQLVLDDTSYISSPVLGTNAMSRKYGISQKAMNNHINRMVSKKLIEREVVRKFHKDIQGNLYVLADLIREANPKAVIFPSKDGKSLIEVVGSKITLDSRYSILRDITSSSLSSLSLG